LVIIVVRFKFYHIGLMPYGDSSFNSPALTGGVINSKPIPWASAQLSRKIVIDNYKLFKDGIELH
jgi:hypothetical protein